ncbi:MAG: Leucine-tRNA ligase [Candidatus Roizmanbacteria bacterium GW2011_GWC2_34_23]|uniref:Leucine--tRNA ligase n=1 Tax=Candidatus Roizmanbacteria bacterium GW2011_GWC2_34_23 TaxID=1618484 RepID=A0A0G0E6G2_9BACT|nr:MAG: Leucine-tRNA ligase [Candidatus Roizmanbacteria bacterium GW2011_GWC2_34_23]
MVNRYQPQEFEKKWAEQWKKEKINIFNPDSNKEKYYVLVELPYTSGDLHIGHWFTFTHPDVLSRFKRMNGFNVFFPMGYDAFGLPAENAAIKRKIHPKDWTMKNIETMTKQFQQMGTMIDWDWMTITCLPEYYRWNQWIFLKMYEKGLAFRGKTLSNWCPSCQTVIANENIENGKCWRCGETVVQKDVEQWFLKITDYAEQLIWDDKPKVDWPTSVRTGQNNWIGKKSGINIDYPVKNTEETITCFTTAPVNFGMTFIVVAPEHDLVKKIISGEIKVDSKCKKEIEEYYKKAQEKTEMDRLMEGKKKTGVFTGLYATNRIAGWDVPVWVADFAIGNVGTGAVQGCPGHDYKDFEFAKKFNLPIIRVVVGEDGDQSEIKESRQIIVKGMKGKMVNSKFLNGLEFSEGLEKTMDYAEEKGWGKRVFSYHIRDWSISRQRYWGTPVPVIHCIDCGIVPVPENNLPIELPYEVDFTPHGKPPLATNEKWLNVKCPKCGKPAKRDAETLDTFFDSAWYWFRYLSPQYEKGPFDELRASRLTPVDVYFGGSEHTLGHTLYARFFTKFFQSLKMLNYDEFALKRIQHGIVLGPDGSKMSKSKGNVINPDDVVIEYGSDTARLYLCFMMPYEGTGAWSTQTIAGVNRFLGRIWKIYQEQYQRLNIKDQKEDERLIIKLKKTIKKVTEEISNIKMNTSIAAMMEFLNDFEKSLAPNPYSLTPEHAKQFLQILAPFAPFMTEEIWRNVFGEKESIHLSTWPKVEGEISFDPP